MGVRIDVAVPQWMVDALASDPEADLWVAFAPQPEMFSRAVKVSDAGVEYAGGGGMTCAQPIGDIVAYRIGPDGETVGVRGVTVELVGETVGVEAPAVVSKAAGNSTSFVYSLTGSTSGFGNFVGYNRPADSVDDDEQ